MGRGVRAPRLSREWIWVCCLWLTAQCRQADGKVVAGLHVSCFGSLQPAPEEFCLVKSMTLSQTNAQPRVEQAASAGAGDT